jgi:hypothetical protein
MRKQGLGKSNLKEREHLHDLGVDGRIILKWNLKKYIWRMQSRFTWPRTGSKMTDFCKTGNKLSGFI